MEKSKEKERERARFSPPWFYITDSCHLRYDDDVNKKRLGRINIRKCNLRRSNRLQPIEKDLVLEY